MQLKVERGRLLRPQCLLNLKVDCTANQAILESVRRPMSGYAVDYSGVHSGTSDSDSESDKVPSTEAPSSSGILSRAFWRMISASFMQVSDAPRHLHRQNRRRSATVTRSSATPPRRASSSSSNLKVSWHCNIKPAEAGAQHQHPKPPKADVVLSSSDPPSSGDDSH
jgi:hypothetical protein